MSPDDGDDGDGEVIIKPDQPRLIKSLLSGCHRKAPMAQGAPTSTSVTLPFNRGWLIKKKEKEENRQSDSKYYPEPYISMNWLLGEVNST